MPFGAVLRECARPWLLPPRLFIYDHLAAAGIAATKQIDLTHPQSACRSSAAQIRLNIPCWLTIRACVLNALALAERGAVTARGPNAAGRSARKIGGCAPNAAPGETVPRAFRQCGPWFGRCRDYHSCAGSGAACRLSRTISSAAISSTFGGLFPESRNASSSRCLRARLHADRQHR